ncbi:hypothetical protein [Alcanivorax sp.]|uniref:hypothetical protein n=1 Tax=Alcanivorax sp. TaxID=1872427 RepID=UPI0025B8459B|nr:hypothetical protein [Alcanivorax sp.]
MNKYFEIKKKIEDFRNGFTNLEDVAEFSDHFELKEWYEREKSVALEAGKEFDLNYDQFVSLKSQMLKQEMAVYDFDKASQLLPEVVVDLEDIEDVISEYKEKLQTEANQLTTTQLYSKNLKPEFEKIKANYESEEMADYQVKVDYLQKLKQAVENEDYSELVKVAPSLSEYVKAIEDYNNTFNASKSAESNSTKVFVDGRLVELNELDEDERYEVVNKELTRKLATFTTVDIEKALGKDEVQRRFLMEVNNVTDPSQITPQDENTFLIDMVNEIRRESGGNNDYSLFLDVFPEYKQKVAIVQEYEEKQKGYIANLFDNVRENVIDILVGKPNWLNYDDGAVTKVEADNDSEISRIDSERLVVASNVDLKESEGRGYHVYKFADTSAEKPVVLYFTKERLSEESFKYIKANKIEGLEIGIENGQYKVSITDKKLMSEFLERVRSLPAESEFVTTYSASNPDSVRKEVVSEAEYINGSRDYKELPEDFAEELKEKRENQLSIENEHKKIGYTVDSFRATDTGELHLHLEQSRMIGKRQVYVKLNSDNEAQFFKNLPESREDFLKSYKEDPEKAIEKLVYYNNKQISEYLIEQKQESSVKKKRRLEAPSM